ncbi:hypothetical protein AB0C14_39480 [Microbispora hainanensis]|uniref:hypothetical protein n=1 Tax=Microbispora hainanensis TaxID=568844 RepID=UPI0033D83690
MLTRSTSALAVVTALTVALTGPAASAADFPTPGAGFKVSLSAEQVTFTCDDKTHTISLKGSASLKAGTPSPVRPLSLPMNVTTAELSGTNSTFGKVTASLEGTQIGELVKQSAATPFPARHVLPLKLKITFGRIDCGGGDDNSAHGSLRRAYEPLVLETKNPARLIGNLTEFPPRGDLYQLQNPVDLILPETPDVTVASIQKFPVQVGGL